MKTVFVERGHAVLFSSFQRHVGGSNGIQADTSYGIVCLHILYQKKVVFLLTLVPD